MSTVAVNVSFQNSLLNEIDKTAKKEYRSRSELIREAARLYIQRQSQWNDLFQLGDTVARKQQLTEHDIATEITALRTKKARLSCFTAHAEVIVFGDNHFYLSCSHGEVSRFLLMLIF